MYLFDLGKLSGQQSMLIFHALARMGIEGLVIVSPENPLASIGYFQDAAMEIDLSFCRENGIPFMRREVEGGATYLDGNQIFYQLIWKRSNPQFPAEMRRIFEEFSTPACETYRKFGIEASLLFVSLLMLRNIDVSAFRQQAAEEPSLIERTAIAGEAS